MAYFNHAFSKTFLGTKKNTAPLLVNPNQSAGGATTASGFIINGTAKTSDLIKTSTTAANNYGLGSYGFFDPATWSSINNANVTSGGKVCCPLVLAATALYQKDQLAGKFSNPPNSGGFLGGYQESNKSKVINPKYLSRFYKVTPCVPNQNVIHVGSTPYTFSQSQNCCFTFLCDQSYSLRVDIKGSPALRMLDHNAYFETAKWTGCCPPAQVAPTAVDPTTVYIAWATQLLNSPLISPFIQIIVYNQAGVAVGGPNDTAAWAAYVPVAVVACNGTSVPGAGMSIIGAYVGTVFGDCTFYPTDFFEKEPVHIYASLVDYTGDVCAFTGICVTESCCPRQGNGFGDTVVKDLILSERYQQNDFYTGTDLRIREITQGYDVTNAVNRSTFYTRYVIQHNVPRFNNPTGVFDNDQYQLEIITNGTDTNLESFMATWTAGCGPCGGMETYSCGACCPVPAVAPLATDAVAYSFQIPTSFGTAPITFSNTGAIGASGLSLASTGLITGATPVAGTYSVTTTATDAYGLVVLCTILQITVTT